MERAASGSTFKVAGFSCSMASGRSTNEQLNFAVYPGRFRIHDARRSDFAAYRTRYWPLQLIPLGRPRLFLSIKRRSRECQPPTVRLLSRVVSAGIVRSVMHRCVPHFSSCPRGIYSLMEGESSFSEIHGDLNPSGYLSHVVGIQSTPGRLRRLNRPPIRRSFVIFVARL